VGELPRELNGTPYRNGPNPQFDVFGAHLDIVKITPNRLP